MPRRSILATNGAVMLLATSVTAVSADPAAAPAGLDNLRATPNYQQAIFKGAQNTTAWINKPCQGAKAHLSPMLGLLRPPVFDEKGKPQSGAWIEHVSVEGCGPDRILNVVVSVQGEGKLGVTPMLPGTSRADPTLQKDAAFYAFAAANVGPNPCKPTYIANAAFVDFSTEAPLVPGKKGWLERWTVVTCDKQTDVELHFIPDASGTVISSRVRH